MRVPRTLATCLAVVTACPAAAPAQETDQKSRPDRSVMHVQVILDHLGFGPGVIDGRGGMSLTAALKGFQEAKGLPITGKPDQATLRALYPFRALRPTVRIALTQHMLAGPYVNPIPKDPRAQAKLQSMAYRTPLEKLAEMFHTTPETLIALNSPSTMITPGVEVVFPNAVPNSRQYDAKLPGEWRQTLTNLNVEADEPKAARIVVDKSDQVLRVLDDQGKLVAQFQATMGSTHDPLPIGTWTIKGPAYNPPFQYNASLFWDAGNKNVKARIPPGPNGPVGVVWLDLSKPHYGIHGTPSPSTIGRAESHGCIRLTNWDAARLSLMLKPGTPAVFQQ